MTEFVAKDLDFQRLASSQAVTVTVPAKVAFDLESLFEVQRSVFERLGHPACYSGADIRFMVERDFVVEQGGRLRG